MIPEPMPEQMRISASDNLMRHLLRLGMRGCEFPVLVQIAALADENGRMPVDALDLDRLVGPFASRPSLNRALKRLLDTGDRLRRDGDTFVIVGVAEHNIFTCEQRQCAYEVAVARRADEWWQVANRPRQHRAATVIR